MRPNGFRTFAMITTLGALAVFGQETAPPAPAQPEQGWRRVSDPAPAAVTEANAASGPLDAFGQRRDAPPPPDRPAAPPAAEQPANFTVPAELTAQPGAFLTVRIDQRLSSNDNAAGDAFSATLVKPLVVDGIVVAQRGQTVAGRVVEVQRSGKVKGSSRLGIELTDLTVADGQQVRIRSQFTNYVSPKSRGRDAGAVVTTTALGAAIGGAAEGGAGAGIGAAAGAAAGLIGVLLTRGHATVIEEESVLTFRLEAPVTISTARAPRAFRLVDPKEFERELTPRYQTRTVVVQPPYWGSYWGGWWPGYYSYPGYWGSGLGFYYSSRAYWGRGGNWGGGRYVGRGRGRR